MLWTHENISSTGKYKYKIQGAVNQRGTGRAGQAEKMKGSHPIRENRTPKGHRMENYHRSRAQDKLA